MDRLLSAKEVAAIVGYKDLEKARKVIRECVHTENPLRVSEKALEAWINGHTYVPGGKPLQEWMEEIKHPIQRRHT